MRKTILIILVTILFSCSGERGETDTDSGCDKLVDSLKLAITARNDSIVKLTQIIDDQADSILKLNGGAKADEYWENTVPKDSLAKK
jgi:hypothetical protein